ncbi:hypothetical protein EUBC25_15800 [Claveliimonas bilis]|uniref:transporter substrate-binding domain-containing protein n=1 Tax=Claveliimonas bilis TaxID=3028070 RepID=UPI001E5B43E0|nr:transporter substrate-binding domain-containing protein [Claveliimonas bilis]BCZ27493.1 hypothetical protein EUBC25_15800 [Claveliimonas bilis]
MKKRFIGIFMTMISLAVLGGCAENSTESASTAGQEEQQTDNLLEDIRERGTITIAMEGTWAPWTYHDENGNLTGYDVEVGQLIAEKLGVEPDF